VATLGFWTYQLIWSAPPPLLAVTSESTPEAEQRRLAAIKEAEQLQAKAADAEAKLQSAEAEQQGLKEEVQRQAKLAADAEAKRKSAEERLTALLKFERGRADAEAATKKPDINVPLPPPPPTGLFTIRPNTEASGADVSVSLSVASRAACEDSCARSPSCKVFAYDKSARRCYRYTRADFKSNEKFDSGIRVEQTTPSADTASSTGLFTIRTNTEASGNPAELVEEAPSIGHCAERCAQSPTCKIFTYSKSALICFTYSHADFKSNEKFDSGIR
jgi:PAN domain